MNEDRGIGAMPKLYGAPAYARPPAVPVSPVERPFDPDDLPLEAERAEGDEAVTAEIPTEVPTEVQGRAYESAVATAPDPSHPSDAAIPQGGSPRLRGRPFRLRLPGRG